LKNLALVAALFAASCADAPVSEAPAEADVAQIAVSLSHEMARNASNLDAQANARFIPDTEKVVYVSKGVPVTGKEYGAGLSEFYANQKSISWSWDKWEVTPIGQQAAVFTGWATIKAESKAGEQVTERAIFTQVFAKTASGWQRVIAQKALLADE
jgi:ketosteroid isomerase-like protein